MIEGDFNEIHDGDTVEFTIEVNEKGNEVAKNVRKVADDYYIPETDEEVEGEEEVDDMIL